MRWSRTATVAASAVLLAATSFLGTNPVRAEPAAARTSTDVECTKTGTTGDDTLEGTGARDVICGLGGDDTINGMAGSDVIDGGSGNDIINGGSGNDTLLGSPDDDMLKGAAGDDTIVGGLGSDTCHQNRGTGSLNTCEWPNPLLTCPVAHGTVYNDFGDPRDGHTHQGNDITAKKGEPVLATFPGQTSNARASGAGLYVTLTRADGSFTYGMHMSKFAKEGRYKTGEVIGYVGSSGNAGSINHLHFEWHPDGGSAIDPFPYLKKVCSDTARSGDVLEPLP